MEEGDSSSRSDSSNEQTSGSEEPSSPYPKRRRRQLPARFRDSSGSEEDDGVECTVCGQREPSGCPSGLIFWVDCDECGQWAHNVCVFGKNAVTRSHLCEKCL